MPAPMPQEILNASVPDVRHLASMLRSLSFRSKATMVIHGDGLKITVEEGRSIQANAYIASKCFSSYTFNVDALPPSPPIEHEDEEDYLEPPLPHCTFDVSLSTILECLNIFGNAGASGTVKDWSSAGEGGGGGNSYRRGGRYSGGGRTGQPELEKRDDGKVTSMRMTYAGEGQPLVLLLEESGTVTRCEITTYESEPPMEMGFDDAAKIQRLIMKSEWLRDALLELDPSSEKVVFSFSPADNAPLPYNRYRRGENGDDVGEGDEVAVTPSFRIGSVGTIGSQEMDYYNSKDSFEHYDCSYAISNSYKFSHIQLMTKALSASIKTSIRTDAQGLMSIQHMIPFSSRSRQPDGENKTAFVEFVCIALDEEH